MINVTQKLTRVEDLKGHVVANAIVVPSATVAEAGVVAAAPLEGQLCDRQRMDQNYILQN